MTKFDFQMLEKYFKEYELNKCKETASLLKYQLTYCAKQINIKKLKSKQIKNKCKI